MLTRNGRTGRQSGTGQPRVPHYDGLVVLPRTRPPGCAATSFRCPSASCASFFAFVAGGWLRWVFVAAPIIPYVAVVFANGGREPAPETLSRCASRT